MFLLLGILPAHGRQCRLEEIRQIDTALIGQAYTPFPMMNKVAVISSFLPLIPRLDSTGSENSTFWTVTLAGVGGMAYFGLKSLSPIDCEDERVRKKQYRPDRSELIRYHEKERDNFWSTYTWSGLWMLGIVLTTQYNERKIAAVGAAILPWTFAFSKRWSAFSDENELQYGIYPGLHDGHQTMNLALQFSF